MPSFLFNKTSNPMMPFFVTMIERYMNHGSEISNLIGTAEGLIGNKGKTLEPEKYQYELDDHHQDLTYALDDYLRCLNYFRLIGPFECRKLLKQQQNYIDLHQPALVLLKSEDAIEKEIREAINTTFNTIERLRDEMDDNTRKFLFKAAAQPHTFIRIFNMDRFIEPQDMNNKMEYDFWLYFSQRLDFYDISKDVKAYLDTAENNNEHRKECIKSRLTGIEQEMFPARLCGLDGYNEEEIDIAKQEIESDRVAHEKAAQRRDDAIARRKKLENPFRNTNRTKTIADSGKNRKNGRADVIPIDRFQTSKREP